MEILLASILLPPLLSFLLLFLVGRKLPRQGDWLAIGLSGLSFLAALFLFVRIWPGGEFHTQAQWFQLASYSFKAGFWVDKLSVLMGLLVTFISLLVQIYSTAYMQGELRYRHYFGYLGLFTFAMLGIVLADSLLLLFIFWELVGLSSYLLIGFWYQQIEAPLASRNAFLINRIGDTGFLIGIMLVYLQFGTSDLKFLTTEAMLPMRTSWSLVVGLGIFCGTIAKSAQFPLQIWLPRAMAGPTPVSALIHAATMVAAGVFLLVRTFPLLDTSVLTIIAITGTITAFMGAVAALFQTDIKRLLAFSTISQLGYMVMAVGVGAPGAGLFHLLTHAFFKAGLFLCAGIVIHALHEAAHRTHVHFDAQDMQRMGGFRKKLPFTFVCYTLCGLALAGLPFFSGFLSKDAILLAAFQWANGQSSNLAWLVPSLGFLTAFLTAFYIGRQLLLVFFGEWRREPKHNQPVYENIEEPPLVMRGPVALLAALSVFLFFSLNPFDAGNGWLLTAFTNDATVNHNGHTIVVVLSVLLSLSGLGAAYWLVMKKTFAMHSFLGQLSIRNWYLEEAFQSLVVLPAKFFIRIAHWVDSYIIDKIVDFMGIFTVVFAHIIAWIDRILVDGLVRLTAYTAGRVGMLTRVKQGSIQTYFVVALLGLIGWVIWVVS